MDRATMKLSLAKLQNTSTMNIQRTLTLSSLIWSWIYGLVCGLGIASSVIGLLRGEALPGIIWPALTPLLLAPILILRVMSKREERVA